VESQVAVVDVTKQTKKMKKVFIYILFILPTIVFAQKKQPVKDDGAFKTRVLETAEVDVLTSLYTQSGDHAAVTGGIGTEQLFDAATNIDVSIPLNDDDVLSIDATVSAYSSASSSNLNPFYSSSGASSGGNGKIKGTPWAASSGASKSDIWASGNFGYSHSSNDRNKIYNANVSFAHEFDYNSFGVGIGHTRLFNEQNTEITLKANAYLDAWNPRYPTEIKTYIKTNGSLTSDFFRNRKIYDINGVKINKNSPNAWKPINTTLIKDKKRNSFSASLSFSQILTKKSQISLFSDVILQQGWLSNPMQRVYFADIDNFYMGKKKYIPKYTTRANKGVFQLADDIERLPHSRLKIPIGVRYNYYINEKVTLRTYYRYYSDDWGIYSHTANIEVPIKISDKYTLYPNFRYYNQTAAYYFAPYETHLSTERFYTSDYDLSKFTSKQFGMGFKYVPDILTEKHFGKFLMKYLTLNYNYYQRNNGLKAHIISFGIKFVNE